MANSIVVHELTNAFGFAYQNGYLGNSISVAVLLKNACQSIESLYRIDNWANRVNAYDSD